MLFYGFDTNENRIVIVKMKYKLFKGCCFYFPEQKAYSKHPDSNDILYFDKATGLRVLLNMGYRPIKSLYDVKMEVEYTDGTVSHIKIID